MWSGGHAEEETDASFVSLQLRTRARGVESLSGMADQVALRPWVGKRVSGAFQQVPFLPEPLAGLGEVDAELEAGAVDGLRP